MDTKDILRNLLSGLTGESEDSLPVGVKWLNMRIKKATRYRTRTIRRRKPAPKGRAALVARQKKFRPVYHK